MQHIREITAASHSHFLRVTKVLVLCLLALLATGRPAMPAESGDTTTEKGFRKWSQSIAKKEKLEICRWGTLNGPSAKISGFFAWFTATVEDNDGQSETVNRIVFASGKRMWVYVDDGDDDSHAACESQRNVFEKLSNLPIDHSDGSANHTDTLTVTIDDSLGPIVLTSGYQYDHLGSQLDEKMDWSTLTRSSEGEETDGSADDGPSTSTRASVLLVLPPDTNQIETLPPVENFVIHGEKAWSGAKDAALQVKASADNGKLRLAIAIQDDNYIPVKGELNPKTLLRADHLELWLGVKKNSRDREIDLRQLGIPVPQCGAAEAPSLWLYPQSLHGRPPVKVSRAQEEIVVEMDLASLGIGQRQTEWKIPFTAVFSDSDDEKAGQQTLVATSTFQFANRDTLGEIVRRKTRFPRLEKVSLFRSSKQLRP